ncbi:aldose 1-epimerase [Paenibacillus sediminis]|uniref:Aldose 1-epimerase n=1 Tax=Paenibacillus sediminis TaxID=664909 RepID=A0ABS4H5Z1_9BACL|nr:aldose 1-epimerase [Paenibacillus sediminis]MBP1937955.1 aldose 1-epimerase [Paenibacillus sediminis]
MKQVTKGQWNGYDTYILHSRDLEVTLLPRLGNNVIGIWDSIEQREVLRRPDEADLDFYMVKPYHFGIPMLIPPGRIRRGHFEYNGVDYQFDQNTAHDNHIHGLHRAQSWRVTDIEEEEESCSITTEFVTSDDPNWMRQYPIPLKLEMTLKLQGSELEQSFKITNLGEHAAPFGLGLHTWFLLDGEPDKWTLTLPVSNLYKQDEEQIPTGDIEPLGQFEVLNKGMNLKGTNMDTLFRIGDKPAEALLVRDDGYGLRYSVDPEYFKHWVLFTKGEADQFLCIEPYTWLPDAPNSKLSPDFTGLIDLKPQQSIVLKTKLVMIHPKQ